MGGEAVGGPYTADQLYEGVLNAIHAHDVRAAIDILEALATVDLKRAIALYGELTDALTVTRVLGLNRADSGADQ